MYKFWTRLAIYLGSLVSIAWANYAVMLHFHPLAYYYTPKGMLLSAGIAVAQALIIWPLSQVYLTRRVLPALYEGMEEKTTKVVRECYEACLSAYTDYKEHVITEFEDENAQ